MHKSSDMASRFIESMRENRVLMIELCSANEVQIANTRVCFELQSALVDIVMEPLPHPMDTQCGVNGQAYGLLKSCAGPNILFSTLLSIRF